MNLDKDKNSQPELTSGTPISGGSRGISDLFYSRREKRLRAGWRLALQTMLFLVLQVAIAFPVLILAQFTSLDLSNQLLNQLMVFAAITGSVFLARRFLDRRSVVDLGLHLSRHSLFDLLAGVVIALIMISTIFLIEVWAGWITIESLAWELEEWKFILVQGGLAVIIFSFVAWNEELLIRGYYLQNLADGLTPVWGAVLSAAVFGVLHLANPNATVNGFAGLFLAGLFFSYCYFRTSRLWVPIGLHLGWNFFEGVVFGFPVSGLDTFKMMRISVSGPEIWTGGNFGPEAGLVLLPAIALGTLLVGAYSRNRHQPDSQH